MNSIYFEDQYKKIGIRTLSPHEEWPDDLLKPYIKILFIPSDYVLRVDFNTHTISSPTLCFLGPNQYVEIQEVGTEPLQVLYYNRDFYCIQIHDKEVACDGLLFNNIFQAPLISAQEDSYARLFSSISAEIISADYAHEEMIRVYLKQIIILATRQMKAALEPHLDPEEVHEFRDFSRLLEIHYRSKHQVADYAELMGLSPKTLTHKFKRWNLENPNEYIKNRLILEAKRLLLYSTLSSKEIAYLLGYDDPAYFNRFFNSKVGTPPSTFKKLGQA